MKIPHCLIASLLSVIPAILSAQSPEAPLIEGFSGYRTESAFQTIIGFALEVGEQPVEVTALGRWKLPDNDGTARLQIFDLAGQAVLPGSQVELNLAELPAGQFHYVDLPAPLRLEPGQTYYIVTDERGSDDAWYHSHTEVDYRAIGQVLGSFYGTDQPANWRVDEMADTSFGPVNFRFRLPTVAELPPVRPAQWRNPPTQAFLPRDDFGRLLEPQGHRVIHGGGQTPTAIPDYEAQLPREQQPLILMNYRGLRSADAAYFRELKAFLDAREGMVIPQLGVGMTEDGRPDQLYTDAVVAGEHDAMIELWIEGLRALERPVYLRLGYEFNGEWNGYEPASFVAAWRYIHERFRAAGLDQVAFVWCYSADAQNKSFMPFYPGDAYVDWWAIDIFQTEHFTTDYTEAFMAEARARQFPVMIGESTPRDIGVNHGEASWRLWFQPYFDFIRRHPHVKAFCYIHWDWSQTRWFQWDDSRIQSNRVVLDLYRESLEETPILHRFPADELEEHLHLTPTRF